MGVVGGPGVSSYNLLQCNPATLLHTRTTCLPYSMLDRLRTEWNRRNPTQTILSSVRTKDALWAALRTKMRESCTTEFCAVKTLGLSNAETHPVESEIGGGHPTQTVKASHYFRPSKPDAWLKKPTEWQDSNTLTHVLEQYEAAYPRFEFIGPVPNDFDASESGSGWGTCISDELCSINLKALQSAGTDSVGIIFNLDAHDKPGSHWVCAYIDLIKRSVYYYDSYGMEPTPEVRRLMRRCRDQGCTRLIWNNIRHQRKSSECGTYCLYVLISLLQGRSFESICVNRVDDDTMNALRDILFATMNPRTGPMLARASTLLSVNTNTRTTRRKKKQVT